MRRCAGVSRPGRRAGRRASTGTRPRPRYRPSSTPRAARAPRRGGPPGAHETPRAARRGRARGRLLRELPHLRRQPGGRGLAPARHRAHARRRAARAALVAAGLGAGVAFAFKPNAGVLGLLACAMGLGLMAAGEGDPDRRAARALLVLTALALLVLLAQALVATLTLDIDWPTFPIIAGAPLVLLAGRLLWARAPVAHAVRLAPALALLALGAAVVTLPWLAYLVARLGWARFLSDVLLLGSGAERVYATPYPLRPGFPAPWAPLAAAAIAAVGALGLAVGPGRLRRGAALGLGAAAALGVGALVALLARMPEGVRRSVLWEVQETGFFLVPILGLAGVGVVLARLRGGGGGLGPAGRRWLVALVFALAMYLQLYPRADSMHLIVAVPRRSCWARGRRRASRARGRG